MNNGRKSPEVVVITGASAGVGVGRAAARAFAEQGAHIGLLARSRDGLEGGRRDVEGRGGRALALPTDVADPEQVEAAACCLILGVLGLGLGTGLFPQIDSGEFVLRFRPPPGSSYELTREMGLKCLQEIEHEAGSGNIEISMGFVGQVAPNFGIDNMVLFMRRPDDGWLRVALNEDSGIKSNRRTPG